MKNCSNLLFLSVCILIATIHITSCSKADEIVVPQALSIDVAPPNPEIDLPCISCSANGQTLPNGAMLFPNTTYTFRLETGMEWMEGNPNMPIFTIIIRNSSGDIVNNPVESTNKTLVTTFVNVGSYTVEYLVNTQKSSNSYTKTYSVIEPGISGNLKLNNQFDLYLNHHKFSSGTTTTLKTEEEVFNKPYCSVVKVTEGHYRITITEPEAYKFTVNYNSQDGLTLNTPQIFHVNIFYRTQLECECNLIGFNQYENRLRLPAEKDLLGNEIIEVGFKHRICFNYSKPGLTPIPGGSIDVGGSTIKQPPFMVIYTNEQDDALGLIKLPNTSVRMAKDVHINGFSQQIQSGQYWIIDYPQDTWYEESAEAQIRGEAESK